MGEKLYSCTINWACAQVFFSSEAIQKNTEKLYKKYKNYSNPGILKKTNMVTSKLSKNIGIVFKPSRLSRILLQQKPRIIAKLRYQEKKNNK